MADTRTNTYFLTKGLTEGSLLRRQGQSTNGKRDASILLEYIDSSLLYVLQRQATERQIQREQKRIDP